MVSRRDPCESAGLGVLAADRPPLWGVVSGRKDRTVKVKASVRRMCNKCQVIRRKGKVRVICKADPKHKQVQG